MRDLRKRLAAVEARLGDVSPELLRRTVAEIRADMVPTTGNAHAVVMAYDLLEFVAAARESDWGEGREAEVERDCE